MEKKISGISIGVGCPIICQDHAEKYDLAAGEAGSRQQEARVNGGTGRLGGKEFWKCRWKLKEEQEVK